LVSSVLGQHHVRLYSQFQTVRHCEPVNLPKQSLQNEPPEVLLVGVSDISPEKAKEIGSKYNVPYYSDYHDLLGKVDAVSIAVPTTLHHVVAMDFLKAGVHCLVEKPIAFSIEEAEQMILAADKKQINLAVGHIERFNPAVTKLKQILDAGTLGQLLTITTRRVGPSVPRIRDVGVVIDSATHDIGVVKYLVGKDPVSVFSRVGSLKHPKEDHAIIILDFKDATACIEVNWFTPHKVRTLVATGSEGIAYLDYMEQSVTIYNSLEKLDLGVQKVEPLKLEIEDFLKSIKEDTQPAVNGAEGRDILRIALASSASNFVAIP
jgi:UDP-N-acetylglucosamine 3-dehydrogenase